MYLCGQRKHNCQPFCGPEGWFDCSDSVLSLWPMPLSYLCVWVRILGVLKIVCCCTIKPNCCLRLLWSPFLIDSAACVLSFYHSTPLHLHAEKFNTGIWLKDAILCDLTAFLMCCCFSFSFSNHTLDDLCLSLVFKSVLNTVTVLLLVLLLVTVAGSGSVPSRKSCLSSILHTQKGSMFFRPSPPDIS